MADINYFARFHNGTDYVGNTLQGVGSDIGDPEVVTISGDPGLTPAQLALCKVVMWVEDGSISATISITEFGVPTFTYTRRSGGLRSRSRSRRGR